MSNNLLLQNNSQDKSIHSIILDDILKEDNILPIESMILFGNDFLLINQNQFTIFYSFSCFIKTFEEYSLNVSYFNKLEYSVNLYINFLNRSLINLYNTIIDENEFNFLISSRQSYIINFNIFTYESNSRDIFIKTFDKSSNVNNFIKTSETNLINFQSSSRGYGQINNIIFTKDLEEFSIFNKTSDSNKITSKFSFLTKNSINGFIPSLIHNDFICNIIGIAHYEINCNIVTFNQQGNFDYYIYKKYLAELNIYSKTFDETISNIQCNANARTTNQISAFIKTFNYYDISLYSKTFEVNQRSIYAASHYKDILSDVNFKTYSSNQINIDFSRYNYPLNLYINFLNRHTINSTLSFRSNNIIHYITNGHIQYEVNSIISSKSVNTISSYITQHNIDELEINVNTKSINEIPLIIFGKYNTQISIINPHHYTSNISTYLKTHNIEQLNINYFYKINDILNIYYNTHQLSRINLYINSRFSSKVNTDMIIRYLDVFSYSISYRIICYKQFEDTFPDTQVIEQPLKNIDII